MQGCTGTPEGNQTILTLDDAKRNVENDRGPYYCDKISTDRRFKASPDWKGPGWYRMKSPAGLQLSEEPVLPYHCSTSGTGWLNGKQYLSSLTTDTQRAFFKNKKLLGLGRQIGLNFFEAFQVFSAKCGF